MVDQGGGTFGGGGELVQYLHGGDVYKFTRLNTLNMCSLKSHLCQFDPNLLFFHALDVPIFPTFQQVMTPSPKHFFLSPHTSVKSDTGVKALCERSGGSI